MQFFRHNLGWKVVSLGAAVLVSVLVHRQEDIRRSTILLPVNLTSPPGQRVMEPPPGFRVRVNLTGPSSLLRKLEEESDEIVLRMDTSRVRPGERAAVPVRVELPTEYRDEVEVDWAPRSLRVRMVADASKVFTPITEVLSRPEGWELQGPLQPIPSRVNVSGPDGALARVVSVKAPVVLDENMRINQQVALQAVDEKGRNITDQVRLEPAQVLVTGMQHPATIAKRVPVQPVFQAPPGTRITAEVEPSRVRVVGPERDVAGIYVVETDLIQVPPGQTEVTRTVPLVPPRENVDLEPPRVKVVLKLQPPAAPTTPPAGGAAPAEGERGTPKEKEKESG